MCRCCYALWDTRSAKKVGNLLRKVVFLIKIANQLEPIYQQELTRVYENPFL